MAARLQLVATLSHLGSQARRIHSIPGMVSGWTRHASISVRTTRTDRARKGLTSRRPQTTHAGKPPEEPGRLVSIRCGSFEHKGPHTAKPQALPALWSLEG